MTAGQLTDFENSQTQSCCIYIFHFLCRQGWSKIHQDQDFSRLTTSLIIKKKEEDCLSTRLSNDLLIEPSIVSVKHMIMIFVYRRLIARFKVAQNREFPQNGHDPLKFALFLILFWNQNMQSAARRSANLVTIYFVCPDFLSILLSNKVTLLVFQSPVYQDKEYLAVILLQTCFFCCWGQNQYFFIKTKFSHIHLFENKPSLKKYCSNKWFSRYPRCFPLGYG